METSSEERKRVLFICVHNSARSQMAETFVNATGGNRFIAYSAGMEPTRINPFAVKVMKEEGFDLSEKRTQSVFDLFRDGRLFDLVITVCKEAEEKCPVFPGITRRLSWAFDDPEAFTGSEPEILNQVRKLKDQIKQRIETWMHENQEENR